jgi:Ni/Co efflux regulator RcnB
MRRLLIGALALAFAVSAPAMAKDRQRGGGGRPAAHMSHGSGTHFRAPRASAGHRTMRVSSHRTVRYGTGHRTVRHAGHWSRHNTVRHDRRHAVAHRNTARFAHARRAVRARHRFHVGAYRRPHGWYRHHWVIGNRLPRGWFARNYWITDWSIYGLWAPIDGLVWVRVGPDAMLIDPATGEVVGVEYGIFF